MNIEQLQKGKDLSEKIKKLNYQLETWKKANAFKYSDLVLIGEGSNQVIDSKYINFEVMKAIAMYKIESELKELTYLFDNL